MQGAAFTDLNALGALRFDARRDPRGAAGDVAAQFEALFVQMMIKAMRDATPRWGIFDSQQMQAYEQMHDQQIALELSERGGIGLADLIEQQLAAAGRVAGVPD